LVQQEVTASFVAALVSASQAVAASQQSAALSQHWSQPSPEQALQHAATSQQAAASQHEPPAQQSRPLQQSQQTGDAWTEAARIAARSMDIRIMG
jgi:hypothetical protein